jgi:nondiscriminating glutamyl-tRNA synthetase
LFCYLHAKKHAAQGGKFVLRIEDTDQSRYVEGAVEQIVQVLQRCGIEIDEGPGSGRGDDAEYTQSQRLAVYQEHLQLLREKDAVYPCFCSAERLDAMRKRKQSSGHSTAYDRFCSTVPADEAQRRIEAGEAHVLRMRMPLTGSTTFTDVVKGRVSIPNKQMDDQVLWKSDGFPTYHLCNVVDDYLMNISHVIRGEEWLNSTPKHIRLYELFGWPLPAFAHLPLLLNKDGSKLSKRHQAARADALVEYSAEEGALTVLPEALVNFLALLGWGPDSRSNTGEVMTMDELVAAFQLEGVQKSGSIVELGKLEWFNTQHWWRVYAQDPATMAQEVLGMLRVRHGEAVPRETVAAILAAMHAGNAKVSSYQDLLEQCGVFLTEVEHGSTEGALLPEGLLAVEDAVAVLSSFQEQWVGAGRCSDGADADADAFQVLKRIAKSRKLPLKQTMLTMRFVLTQSDKGPALKVLVAILGPDAVGQRVRQFVAAAASL